MRKHEETAGVVGAHVAEVFEYLDDQTRLSAHMTKRSWKMGWGKMDVRLDAGRGRTVGSHIVLDGRAFGIHIYLDEVVTEHTAPSHKRWQTAAEPRLLVIGDYTMGFDLTEAYAGSRLRVLIDYDLPRRGMSRALGWLFGGMYARWCARQMVKDAQRAFAPG